MDSNNTMPKLTAGVGATYTSALAKALIFVGVGDQPKKTHSIPQVGREVLSGLLLVAGASDQHLDARMRRGDPGQGGQQHVQTFARLVDTTDEEQRRVLSRVAGKRCVRPHSQNTRLVGDEDGIAARV